MPPERELGLDPLLRDGEAALLETRHLGLREARVDELGEGRAAPQAEGGAKGLDGVLRIAGLERAARLGCELLEAIAVDLARLGPQRVAGRACEHARLAERAPQTGHDGLQRIRGVCRSFVLPEGVHKPIRRDGLVGMRCQERDESPLTMTHDIDLLAAVAEHLELAEDSELHVPLPCRPDSPVQVDCKACPAFSPYSDGTCKGRSGDAQEGSGSEWVRAAGSDGRR